MKTVVTQNTTTVEASNGLHNVTVVTETTTRVIHQVKPVPTAGLRVLALNEGCSPWLEEVYVKFKPWYRSGLNRFAARLCRIKWSDEAQCHVGVYSEASDNANNHRVTVPIYFTWAFINGEMVELKQECAWGDGSPCVEIDRRWLEKVR